MLGEHIEIPMGVPAWCHRKRHVSAFNAANSLLDASTLSCSHFTAHCLNLRTFTLNTYGHSRSSAGVLPSQL